MAQQAKPPTALWKAYRAVRKYVLHQRYVTLPVAVEKVRLRRYEHARRRVHEGHVAASDRVALCVHWNPTGDPDVPYLRLLDALAARGVAIVLVINGGAGADYVESLKPRCWRIVERDNQGADFGAWKDGVDYLRGEAVPVDRLLLFNDSVYFRQNGLAEFVDAFLEPRYDVTAAFENWGEGYHVQSFALAVSRRVYESPQFTGFWRDYVPVTNRIHAIERGEKKLSQAVLAAAVTTNVLYSNARLFDALREGGDLGNPLSKMPIPRRDRFADAIEDDQSREWVSAQITEVMESTSPIHAGAYYFPKYLGCPILKYDIVYRDRFYYWEVQDWCRDFLGSEEQAEYLDRLRRKGHGNMLKGADKRKFAVGVK